MRSPRRLSCLSKRTVSSQHGRARIQVTFALICNFQDSSETQISGRFVGSPRLADLACIRTAGEYRDTRRKVPRVPSNTAERRGLILATKKKKSVGNCISLMPSFAVDAPGSPDSICPFASFDGCVDVTCLLSPVNTRAIKIRLFESVLTPSSGSIAFSCCSWSNCSATFFGAKI